MKKRSDKKLVAVLLPLSVYQALKKAANEANRSVSGQIRYFVLKNLRELQK